MNQLSYDSWSNSCVPTLILCQRRFYDAIDGLLNDRHHSVYMFAGLTLMTHLIPYSTYFPIYFCFNWNNANNISWITMIKYTFSIRKHGAAFVTNIAVIQNYSEFRK